MPCPIEKAMQHSAAEGDGFNGQRDATYQNVTLRKEGDVLVVEVDGEESRLPGGSASAYFTWDGRVAVSVYAHLYTNEAVLEGPGS